MKLAARDFERFARAPGGIGALLVYGSDAGQVRQRVAEMCAAWLGASPDPMASCELSAEALAGDATLLADELAAFSLMAPRRVVLLREPGDKLLDAITSALAHRAGGNFLILYVTETLGRDSKLRHWAEAALEAAALPCYKDEGAGLEQFIAATLRGYGLRAAPEVLRYLAHQLAGDRQVILAELEKLSLYLGDEAEAVTLEDAQASVGEHHDRGMDAWCEALFGGEVLALFRLTDKVLGEGTHPLVLARAAMRYAQRLEQIAQKCADGLTPDAAIDALRPAVFFKAKPTLKAHAARWDAAALARALARLHLLELDSKRYADAADARFGQGLLEVTGLAGRAKRAA